MFALKQYAQPISIRRLGMAAAFALLVVAGGFHEALAAGAEQTRFPSPEEAVKALVQAVKAGDMKTLAAILGAEAKPLVSSGDAVADKQAHERFVQEYEQANRLEKAGEGKAILVLGQDNWPFPIPLVKQDDVWRFDTAAGKQEILNRRIGRNELSAIQVCQAYVDAQREYAREDHDGDGLLKYAMKFVSDGGKKNGLYWETKEGEAPSPLGPLVANARAAGYSAKQTGGKPTPYYGYFYKILTAQGKDAPGGAYDYVVNGKIIGGFALVAYPAQYGVSGVMTFIVNHDGIVYQKDLGQNTAADAANMTTFNPDTSWKRL